MKCKFLLIKQHPKGKPVAGYIDISNGGAMAIFFTENDEPFARLLRVRIEAAGATGIMLSGFEKVDEKYKYQEWWLIYNWSAVGDKKCP